MIYQDINRDGGNFGIYQSTNQPTNQPVKQRVVSVTRQEALVGSLRLEIRHRSKVAGY